jgi:putative RecB family exonuclease
VLRRYHARVRDSYRPAAATEVWFELPVGEEAVVVGSIDRVDVDDAGDLHVVDYKTNRRVSDRARVARSLQLAIYALACEHLYGRLPRTVSLDFVVAGLEVRVDRDELDLDAARRAVVDTARSIRAGEFAPTPNRLCEWCDFRALCPAWDAPDGRALGPAEQELARLRRQVVRDVRALRELEAGVARIRAELEVPPPEEGPDGRPDAAGAAG